MLKKSLILLSTVVFILAAIYVINDYTKSNVPSSNIETVEEKKESAYDFTLKDLEGNTVSLKDFKGKKVFLNFWATWCSPCKSEMPDIEKLYNENKDSDLVILAVNMGDSKDTVKKFIDTNKYNFKVLLDVSQTVSNTYKIVSIPTSFFINKEGNIVHKHTGVMSYEDMKNFIKDL